MSDKFVVMEKDGGLAEVHPTTVESHKAVGWKLSDKVMPAAKAPKAKAEDVPAAEEKPAPKNVKNFKSTQSVAPEE